jgi:hypothetical protein
MSPSADRRNASFTLGVLISGLLVFLAGVCAAVLIRRLGDAWPAEQERVVQMAALLALVGIVLPTAIYLGIRRRAALPHRAGLLVLAATGAALVAFYLTWESHYVEFPADILIWSEGDFVNDIVKFRVGYPLYTEQQNNDSFHYMPGAQLCTYAIARICGAPGSIPMYREIQLFYTLVAAGVAVSCFVRLLQLSGTTRFAEDRGLWGAIALPLFFLIATNSVTNPFVANLNIDALTQLVTVTAYWLLLDYVATRRAITLAMMAGIPAVGFFVKQSLAIWIPLYGVYLLFFDSPRSTLRAASFVTVSFAGLGLLLAGCLGIWGEPFWYWTVREMATHDVSPLRSFAHLLDGWMYYAAGLLAGLMLLRGTRGRRLLGPWLIWLMFLLTMTYTSGIEWMINHLGPGCLLAGIWFLAALARVWPAAFSRTLPLRPITGWARTAIGVVLVCLVYAGLGLISMPMNPLPADAYRYIAEIEREFAGSEPGRVLLDVGAWIPARDLVVQKDQAPSIGSRGSSRSSGDFSRFFRRLEEHYYEKILVRNLDAPACWYDDSTWWRRSSGIKRALSEHYQEAGRIKAVAGEKRFILFSFEPVPFPATRYGFKEITILTPRPKSHAELSAVP